MFVALFVTAGPRAGDGVASASSWRFVAGLAVALVVVAALGVGQLFRRHPPVPRHAGSTLGWVAATVAIAFAIENILAVALPAARRTSSPTRSRSDDAGNDGIVTVGGATFQLRSLFVIALGLVLVVGRHAT